MTDTSNWTPMMVAVQSYYDAAFRAMVTKGPDPDAATKRLPKMNAKATLCGSKGDQTGRQKFYQIFLGDEPSDLSSAWTGPFRDSTDAENAAHDEAKRRGLELDWWPKGG